MYPALQEYSSSVSTMQYLRDHDVEVVWNTFHACGAEQLQPAAAAAAVPPGPALAGPTAARGWWEQDSEEEQEEEGEGMEEDGGAGEQEVRPPSMPGGKLAHWSVAAGCRQFASSLQPSSAPAFA